jgi:hypothetical protein
MLSNNFFNRTRCNFGASLNFLSPRWLKPRYGSSVRIAAILIMLSGCSSHAIKQEIDISSLLNGSSWKHKDRIAEKTIEFQAGGDFKGEEHAREHAPVRCFTNVVIVYEGRWIVSGTTLKIEYSESTVDYYEVTAINERKLILRNNKNNEKTRYERIKP